MLKVQNLYTSYRGIKALRGVSLEVRAGEMVALIGSNGAGKSTLLNSISGVVRAESGEITFQGKNIVNQRPWKTARSGLLQVPEGRKILAELSVAENLEIGTAARGNRSEKFSISNVFDLFPILRERRNQLAGSLSGGQQQMLAIGRCLMSSPEMILLDEPSLGLAPLVVSHVFEALKYINSHGMTVLLVEQNARKALEVTSRAYVLDRGQVVSVGHSNDLASDRSIVAHYLGE